MGFSVSADVSAGEEESSEEVNRKHHKHHHRHHHAKYDTTSISSEKELVTVELSKDSSSSSRKDSQSKLPRRKQKKDDSPKGSAQNNTYERNGLKALERDLSLRSIGPAKVHSASKAVPANKPAMQKSKSQIPKSAKSPPVVHGAFKQDGYTLAYLERQKSEMLKKKDISTIMNPKNVD